MKWLLLVIYLLSTSAIHAQNADWLIGKCQFIEAVKPTSTQVSDTAYCVGYINGAVSSESLANVLFGNTTEAARVHFCIPEQAEGKELALVFLKYVSDHPETRHLTSSRIIWKAMFQAYPCHS